MNEREKLINLIRKADKEDHESATQDEHYAYMADDMIANGVTLDNQVSSSKWIPVTERLPEEDSNVLAYLRIGEEGRIYPANYAKGVWFDCIFGTPATKTTTHWMLLPEPPKEVLQHEKVSDFK